MQLRPQAGRGNALITPPPPDVIIYGSAQSDSLQNELFNSLEERSISYQLQIGLSSLSSLFHNPKPKQIVLLLTNIYSEDVIKQELKGKNVPPEGKFFYTYPYRLISSSVSNLSSVKEVLSVCENIKKAGKRGGSIRLSGVHSINKNYSSSKSITKVSSESHYQSLLYYRNNDYGSIDSPLYQQIIDIFSKDTAYHPFLDFSTALKQVQSQPDRKTLVICPSRLAQQISKTLKKKEKQQSTDILLIGALHPNRFIISKSVVLATESPARVYEYLKDKNMVSPHIISVLFEQLIRNSKVERQREHEYTGSGPDNNKQVHTIVTDFFDNISRPVGVKNQQDIEKAQESRHKIKKIKSPGKSRPSEVTSSFKEISELDSLHLDGNNKPISIKVSEPQDHQIVQTPEFYTNKQGERLKKGNSSEQITSAPNISYPAPAIPHHYPTAHEIRPKMSKFRNPSTIIHQTSDEYRGSNKESIVNDDPELKYEVQRATRVFRKEQTTQPQVVMVESEQVIQDPQRYAQNGNRQQSSNTYNIYSSPTRQQGNNNSQQGSYQWSNRMQSTSPSRPYARIQQETATKNPITYTFEPKEGTRTYGKSGNQEAVTRTYGNNHYRPNQQYSSNYSRQLENHSSDSLQQNVANGYRGPSSPIPANRANVQIVSPSGVTATTALSRGATSPVRYNSTNYNLEGYERVEVNGITMYRKKQANNQSNTTMNNPIAQPNTSQARYTITSNTYSSQPNHNSYNSNHTNETHTLQYSRDSSPKVLRYEVSPSREAQAITQEFTNREYSRQVPSSPNRYVSNYVSSSNYSPRVDEKTSASKPGGHLKDRAEVQRYQYHEQRLQAGNPGSRTFLNDSCWATRPSELISDGSVLRRNNIRFGVKPRREDVDLSVASNKLTSGIYTVRDLNKKMSLTKKVEGEVELQREMEHYRHVEIDLTPCHFLIQDELAYIQEKIASIAGAPHQVDRFACLQDLLQITQEQLDYGVVLASPEEQSKINPNLLPEDYYLLLLLSHPSPVLELNYQLKTITVDSLQRLPLAQKIILDQKLYQYVLFRPGNKDIEAVAGIFNNSEYIIEKCEVPFSCEFLDCYYEEMPQLTRVYLICKEEEVNTIASVVKDYERNNAFFQASSLRIVCPSHEKNIETLYPFLTVLPCLELTYPELISLVHSKDKQPTLSIHPDKFYLHEQHQALLEALNKQFPKRFDFYIYQNASELPGKQTRRKRPYSSYLLLHESILGEKVNLQSFSRVFMMGRAKTLPRQVVRVMKKEELIALLKKP